MTAQQPESCSAGQPEPEHAADCCQLPAQPADCAAGAIQELLQADVKWAPPWQEVCATRLVGDQFAGCLKTQVIMPMGRRLARYAEGASSVAHA